MKELNASIDWESQKVLSQIADGINKPLTRLVQLIELIKSKKDMTELETKQLSTFMLESSDQIEALIADIVKAEENKRIEILVHDKFKYPELYTFDEMSLNASNNLNTELSKSSENRISQADIEWLMQLENTIIENINSYSFCVSWLAGELAVSCLLYTSPSPRDQRGSRMPSSA